MKRYLLKLVIIIVLASHSFFVWSANDKAFFWQVDSNASNATIYLMGSIHFADESFYPLRTEITKAFNSSNYLVVELDVDEEASATYSKIIANRGVIENGGTIKDVLTEDTWTRLRQRLNLLNVSYDAVKSYKPGVLVLTLTSVQVMKLGLDPELGIDAYFLNQSKSSKEKKIIELETIEQQVNLFLDIPDGNLLLKESLHSFDDSEVVMADMVRYWKSGDEQAMNKLLFEDALTDYPAFTEIYDKLFYDRNASMTARIKEMLNSKGTYFVVVGSGHLIGEKGIVDLLRKQGYQVKRR